MKKLYDGKLKSHCRASCAKREQVICYFIILSGYLLTQNVKY